MNHSQALTLVALAMLAPLAGCRERPAAPSAGSNSTTTANSAATPSSAVQARTTSPSELPPGTLPEPLWSAGWISLFDGRTLFGWEAGSEADWQIEDGTIVVRGGEKGLLCTTTEFADYVLQAEFRAEPGTNSGIFLRTPLRPQDPQRDCYELNIAPPDNPFPTGSLVGRAKVEADTQGADWRQFEVTLNGPRVTVQLDGQQVLDYTDPQPLGRGRIGLQLNEGQVAFRNLRLRPLNLTSIFDGNRRDLRGWKTYPDMASRFSVTEQGELRVQDGRGQLETEASYGDLILQLQVKTLAPELNSGVFFRCIPGEQMNGYEMQIHNGVQDGDRSQPADFGTGAIFRRAPARFVAANDQQWFGMTLVASGPHISTWVNGLQVTDWTDERPPHENPRNGLRLDAGTIMLQGHDPTTDILFRRLEIQELP